MGRREIAKQLVRISRNRGCALTLSTAEVLPRAFHNRLLHCFDRQVVIRSVHPQLGEKAEKEASVPADASLGASFTSRIVERLERKCG